MIRADRDSSSIHVYDGRGSSDVLHTFDKMHSHPVVLMKVMVMFRLECVVWIFCALFYIVIVVIQGLYMYSAIVHSL